MATYKSILESICKLECKGWLEKLLDNNSIEYLYTDFIDPYIQIEKDRDLDGFHFSVFIRVRLAKLKPETNYKDLQITGFVYQYGIEPCTLWDTKSSLLWADSENVRKACKIEKLEL